MRVSVNSIQLELQTELFHVNMRMEGFHSEVTLLMCAYFIMQYLPTYCPVSTSDFKEIPKFQYLNQEEKCKRFHCFNILSFSVNIF